MYPEAYREWIEIFDDDLSKIWQNEQKEMQKVSILLCALQKELKNIQTNIEVEVSNLKQQLKYKNDLEKKAKSLSPLIGKKKSPNGFNKENDKDKEVGLKEAADVALRKNQTEKESPDLFRNIDLNAHCSSTDLSIVDLSISEDDTTKIEGSPTIKKRRKRHRVIANPLAFSIITEKPVTPLRTAREVLKTNLFKTPVAKSDLDLSVIDNTPEVVPKRSRISTKVSDFMSKKKSRNKKTHNSTLTQMFRRVSERNANDKTADGADSDETFFDEDIDESKLGITDLIRYINKDDSRKQDNDTATSNRGDGGNEGERLFHQLETSSQEIDQFSKGAIFNEEDIQSSTEKPKVVTVEPEPVVRGKARQQLRGWACQQCRDFYGKMKLSPEEMQKKMDQCSRHRYKYNPPNETIPGFWDLSIPPESIE